MKSFKFSRLLFFENLFTRLFAVVALRKAVDHDSVAPKLPQELAGGKYSFVSYLGKSRYFIIAEYENESKEKFIAKVWSRKFKDKSYYRLKNEYHAYQALHDVIDGLTESERDKLYLRIPGFALYLEEEDLSLLLVEKLEGETMSNFSVDQRIELIDKGIKFLNYLYKHTADPITFDLKVRNSRYFVLVLLVLFPIAVIRYFKISPRLIRLLPFIFKNSYPVSKSKSMTFAHRDLHPWNVIKSGNESYLIDFEIMVIAQITHDIGNAVFRTWAEKENQQIMDYMNILKTEYSRNELKYMCIYSAVFDMVFNGETPENIYKNYFNFLLTY